ncbi:hypothetical protein [Novosphingobium mangrovi (ex Huang et al. 2023)]|uniref:Uncharacterized protein n=1 Tax=Novosphingobium mangrovi (ex Huang et al. 2023) TaxID=2976432 RepID=A0ABT2IA82_9SPHN|nr:hypothetical protein [Novosphingobium mangrovi (ex Huang et al. 2023)]MCT2401706.1 hypothetical protein [Novosphingobium mangrovi (ex Huang et al. 2023)]
MSTQTLLPEGFSGLEPFVTGWALAGSAARAGRRGASTPEERAAFHAAAAGELPRALDYLDAKGFAAFDDADERLMNLMLSLGHVALAVEQQKDAEPRHARDRAHMHITRTPAGA